MTKFVIKFDDHMGRMSGRYVSSEAVTNGVRPIHFEATTDQLEAAELFGMRDDAEDYVQTNRILPICDVVQVTVTKPMAKALVGRLL